MKIVAIREATVPIGTAMRNASIAFDTMTASALAIVTDRLIDGRPAVGYAFDSIGRYGKGALLRERFIPRLLAASADSLLDDAGLIDPAKAWRAAMTNEKDGGHGERPGAIGLLDAALWDLRAKLEGLPLWRVLAARDAAGSAPGNRTDKDGTPDGSFALYGSCGHFHPGRGREELARLGAEVGAAMQAGYTLVKIKLGGADVGDDAARVEAAQEAVVAHGARIAGDLNGRLDPAIAPAWFARMATLGLAWAEEPAPPLDYARLAEFAAQSEVPIATGENLFSFDDARNLLRYGGLRPGRDRIQVDLLLAYGVPEYERILAAFDAQGWPRSAFVPHAGHLFHAHAVAGYGLGLQESAPDAALPYGGLWDGCAVEAGRSRIPETPGVGFEAKANLFRMLEPLSAG